MVVTTLNEKDKLKKNTMQRRIKMAEIVYCKDCRYSTCWRKDETAEKYGKGMVCSRGVLLCPDDYDFCSKGEEVLKCPNCGSRYETLPNFCPECGTKLLNNYPV